MKPAPFEYHAPESVADVAVARSRSTATRPRCSPAARAWCRCWRCASPASTHIIDLNRVDELRGRRAFERHAHDQGHDHAAHASSTTRRRGRGPAPRARPLPLIGHFQIRNRGHRRRFDRPRRPRLGAAGGRAGARRRARGRRSPAARARIPAADFFLGTWTTAIGEDEILAAVHFPVWAGRCGFAVEEVARRSGDFALAGVRRGGRARRRRHRDPRRHRRSSAWAPRPMRARQAEAGARRHRAHRPPTSSEIGRLAVADTEPTADVHASAEYRKHVGAHLVVTRARPSPGRRARG